MFLELVCELLLNFDVKVAYYMTIQVGPDIEHIVSGHGRVDALSVGQESGVGRSSLDRSFEKDRWSQAC